MFMFSYVYFLSFFFFVKSNYVCTYPTQNVWRSKVRNECLNFHNNQLHWTELIMKNLLLFLCQSLSVFFIYFNKHLTFTNESLGRFRETYIQSRTHVLTWNISLEQHIEMSHVAQVESKQANECLNSLFPFDSIRFTTIYKNKSTVYLLYFVEYFHTIDGKVLFLFKKRKESFVTIGSSHV